MKSKKPSSDRSGTVYLVGAGPGDPGLLTLRGKALLQKAQVVFFDHLVNPQILRHCRRAKLVDVGKTGYGTHASQKKIQRSLIRAAKQHSTVVRLKGGDPFIFGRGGEEAESLRQAGIRFEVVPGVTSAVAVPAYAGIPLTHRQFGSTVSFVTGHEDPRQKSKRRGLDWKRLAREETLVFLMGVKSLGANFKKLIAHGKGTKTPAAIIEWGTYRRQRTLTGDLQSLPIRAALAGIQSPAVTVVGPIVKLREKLQWFEPAPLLGKSILVSRPEAPKDPMVDRLLACGARVLLFPALKILPPRSWRPVDAALRRLETFDWLIFTSVHGVEGFFQRALRLGTDRSSFRQVKIAAVGPATARALQQQGFKADAVPKSFTSADLGKFLSVSQVRGKKILLPRAMDARPEILHDLAKKGAKLETVTVYRSVAPNLPRSKLKKILDGAAPDLLTFASAATVRNFHEMLKGYPEGKKFRKIPVFALGPVTRKAALELGYRVAGMPRRHTVEDLVAEISKYFTLESPTRRRSKRQR